MMWKLLLLIFLIFMLHRPCAAQGIPRDQKEVNEIFSRLQKSPSDSVRIDLIWTLGRYHLAKPGSTNNDLDSALNYFQYSIRVIDSLGLKPSYKYEAMCRIGETYFLLHNTKAGKDYFMQVIRAYQTAKDKGREARTWLRLAIKVKIGNYKDPDIPGYLAKALSFYRELHDRKKEADVLLEMGVYAGLYNNLDSAESKFLQVEQIHKEIGYNNHTELDQRLVNIYRRKGDFNKALFFSLQAFTNATERGDTASMYYVGNLADLAVVYLDLEQRDKSIVYYKIALAKSLSFAAGKNVPNTAYNTAANLIQVLIADKKVTEAFNIARKLINDYPPAGNPQNGYAAYMMGECYAALKQYDLAEKNLLQMAKFFKLSPHNEIALDSWGPKILTEFYLERKKYDKATQMLNAQYVKASANYLPYLGVIENELSYFKIDSANNNYLSAYNHLKKYKALNDSAFNVTKNKQLTELQVHYETTKKENYIKQLKKNGMVQQEEVKQANNARNLTLTGVALLILFIGLLYNSYRLNQRKNVALNRLVNEKDNLLIEKERLLTEKEWLLKEIHHRVKNNLQIVMGLLQQQSAYIDNNEALAAIQNSENRMRSISIIHQKLYQSDNLDLISMPDYVDELIRYLADSFDTGSRLYFEKELDEIYLDVSQAVPLGLILNEAITNAIKYGYPNNEAGIIYVSLRRVNDEQNLLVIKDQGPGLPADFDLEKIDSLGLNLMRGLSKQVYGTFEILNQEGVTINVTFKTEKFIGVRSNKSQATSFRENV